MRTIAAICLALAVAGCGLILDREAIDARDAAKAEASCRAIGLDPSSEKWVDCMILMMAAEKQGAAARAAAAATRAAARRAAASDGGKQGLSFMCKDAISRGDSGGTFIFC